MTQTPVRQAWVEPYRADIAAGVLSYARRAGVIAEDPRLIEAVGLRETWLGNMPGYKVPPGAARPDGTGDHGHGRGLFQIDDRGPFKHLIHPAPWPVQVQVEAACEVLADARRQLMRFINSPSYLIGVVCAYNAGTAAVYHLMETGGDPNHATFGGDYGADVWRVYAVLVSGIGA